MVLICARVWTYAGGGVLRHGLFWIYCVFVNCHWPLIPTGTFTHQHLKCCCSTLTSNMQLLQKPHVLRVLLCTTSWMFCSERNSFSLSPKTQRGIWQSSAETHFSCSFVYVLYVTTRSTASKCERLKSGSSSLSIFHSLNCQNLHKVRDMSFLKSVNVAN